MPLNKMAGQLLICHHFHLTGGGILRLREGGGHKKMKPALQSPVQGCSAEGQGDGRQEAGGR